MHNAECRMLNAGGFPGARCSVFGIFAFGILHFALGILHFSFCIL